MFTFKLLDLLPLLCAYFFFTTIVTVTTMTDTSTTTTTTTTNTTAMTSTTCRKGGVELVSNDVELSGILDKLLIGDRGTGVYQIT